MSRRTRPARPAAPVAAVEIAVDADGEEFTLDFGNPVAATRTAEESAAHRAEEARRSREAAIAFQGARSLGLDDRAARRAAALAKG